jgi:lactate permease
MPTWPQVYTPFLENLWLSALLASLPVVVLLGLLAFTKIKAHVSALLGLVAALLVAILIYQMPVDLACMAALHGACYGLLPIGWIVLNAIFIYDLTVASGDFDVVKKSIASLASDRRIQALLIAFSFGAFIEGAAVTLHLMSAFRKGFPEESHPISMKHAFDIRVGIPSSLHQTY